MSICEVLKPSERCRRRSGNGLRALLDAFLDAASSADYAPRVRLHEAGSLGQTRARAASALARHTQVEIKGEPPSARVRAPQSKP